MIILDFLWSSQKEYFSIKPLYNLAKSKKWNTRFIKIHKHSFRNWRIKNNLSQYIVISHDSPLKRVQKHGWNGKYFYVEHGLGPMKYYTYKYNFFHDADLLFYPGEVFKRKMEAINPNFKNGLLGGYPKTDTLYKTSINKIQLYEKYSLNPELPVILFAPSWGGKYFKDSGINNIKYFNDVKNVISVPHPADFKIAKKYKATIPKKGESINNLIHFADLVISDVSSVLAEACLLDKPVIQLELNHYPGCFPDLDKRGEDSWISNKVLELEIQNTDLNKRPFKIPYINEDWIMGHSCKPQNVRVTINQVLLEKDKYKDNRKYWAEQCGWKFDGKISDRILTMMETYIKTGKIHQIEAIS